MASNDEIAQRLIDCQDRARTLASISAGEASFDVGRAYEVLAAIVGRRIAQDWRPVGRKIGFTNRTIWSRYGVDRPMWAPVWAHSVHFASEGRASLSLERFVQPRIEPEVVFKLGATPPDGADATALLGSVQWIAPGFEIVQSHFPDWKFTAADCTAAFGLHGALVVGAPFALTPANRTSTAELLQTFELVLSRDGRQVERGTGSNVLGSPLNALAHLAKLLATQPQFPALAAGEVITTGTLTDAWPVRKGETWESDYGSLGVAGLTLRFE